MARVAALVAVGAAAASGLELRVSTAIGTRFLDKKLDLAVDDSSTVADLKAELEARFPGAPPASLQRLFLGSRLLRDDEAAASLAEDDDDDEDDEDDAAAPARVPVTLDVAPPVAAGRPRPPDELEDRVKAYAAEVVALEAAREAFLGDFGAADGDDALRCAALAARVRAYEATLLETLKPQLAARAARVTSGVVRDGRAGRDALATSRDPRAAFFTDKAPATVDERLAVGLDLDWREAAKVGGGLLFAAQMGARDRGRQLFLLSLVPLALAAQTRPARFLFKVLWYALPRGPQRANGFFDAFLNGPQQLILAMDEDSYVYELFRPLVVDDELAEAGDDGSTRGLRRDDGEDWVEADSDAGDSEDADAGDEEEEDEEEDDDDE